MSDAKYTTSAKILKGLAYVLMGAAIILIMLGFSGFFMGPIHPALDPVYMLLFGFLLFMASVPLLLMAQQGIIKPEFDSISLLKCTNTPDCKFTKGRKWEKDEYVFQQLEEKCEKCSSNLYIAAIFEVERKPPSEKKEEEKSSDDKKEEESWNIKDEQSKSQ